MTHSGAALVEYNISLYMLYSFSRCKCSRLPLTDSHGTATRIFRVIQNECAQLLFIMNAPQYSQLLRLSYLQDGRPLGRLRETLLKFSELNYLLSRELNYCLLWSSCTSATSTPCRCSGAACEERGAEPTFE
jgi:hypothetical protein